MLDFYIAQKEIERLVSLFPQAPNVFLITNIKASEKLPNYLSNRLKTSDVFIKQTEKGNLLINGIYFDDSTIDLALKQKELIDAANIVFFLDRISNIERLHEVFMHEVLGHYAVNRTMSQRMRDQQTAQAYLSKGISEYNLFYDHVLSKKSKQNMRKTYQIPAGFLTRFKHSSRIRHENGQPVNLLLSAITAQMLKNDFDSLVASEIIAHSVNNFLKSNKIEDARKLGEMKSQHGSSLWDYTRGDMTALKQLDIKDEDVVHDLIFAWMICPAMKWLITPKSA